MITPGAKCPLRESAEKIAWKTVKILSETIDREIPGIFFLTGEHTEECASLYLNAIS